LVAIDHAIWGISGRKHGVNNPIAGGGRRCGPHACSQWRRGGPLHIVVVHSGSGCDQPDDAPPAGLSFSLSPRGANAGIGDSPSSHLAAGSAFATMVLGHWKTKSI